MKNTIFHILNRINFLRNDFSGSLLLIIIGFFSISSVNGQSSQLYGTVKTTQGEPLPYANVVILGQSKGTSTNVDGEYSLSLAEGTYRISYQFVGYKSEVREIKINPNSRIALNINLAEEKLFLNAVTVSANNENPAYRIIRNAQDERKKYLNEHQNLSLKVYTKLFGRTGNNRQPPFIFFGTELVPRQGIFYLSEASTNIYIHQKGRQTEEMEASLVLGDTSNYSQNNSLFINLYENRPFSIGNQMVTNRIISPIANDAFGFYDYKLIGSFQEGDLLIHKISLNPKTGGNTTFVGDIYIIDGSWRIFKSHLFIDSKIIGDMEINSTYIQDDSKDTWLPFSNSFIIKNKSTDLEVYHHNIHYDYSFDAPAPVESEELNYKVDNTGLQRSKTWWEDIRPIALTDNEKQAYQLDEAIKNSKGFEFVRDPNDSLFNNLADNQESFFRKYQKAMNRGELNLTDNLFLKLSLFTYNTVEGGVLKPHIVYRDELKNEHRWSAEAAFRYGFASQQPYAKVSGTYELNPLNISHIQLGAGSYVEEILGNTSISDYWNMVLSLEKFNFLKLYGRDYVSAQWSQELYNGLDITLESSYNRRTPLQNNSDFNWSDDEELEFTPNQAFIQGEFIDFESNRLWAGNLLISYQHKRKFDLINGRKKPLSSKYPKLQLGLEMGFLDSEYSRIWGNITDSWTINPLGSSTLSISYGEYIAQNNLTPIDYFHFMGNRTILSQFRTQYGLAFQVMDYYLYSNSNYFAGANFEHDFDGAIFGRIPLLKKLGLKSYFMANYLHTAYNAHYTELGIGLTTSFFPIRFDFFSSYEGNKFQRFGIMLHSTF